MDKSSRRELLKTVIAAAPTCVAARQRARGAASLPSAERPAQTRRLVNAYYFRANMYTMVPRHVREDLEWMAGIGTGAVSIAVLEQDFFAAQRNIDLICEEAHRLKMKVFAAASRWGGLVAGAPKVPSLFSATHPETWMLNRDGTPVKLQRTSGVISSVHHPATYAFFCDSIDKLFRQFDLDGIIWDEPKAFRSDYSKMALARLGDDPAPSAFWKAAADFYGRLSLYVRQRYPAKTVTLFMVANCPDEQARQASQIPGLDYYGCDGRPWTGQEELARTAKAGEKNQKPKVLLGRGELFLRLSKQEGKRGVLLVENLSMSASAIPLMETGLPRVLALEPDQLIYYYYPRDIEDADRNMEVVARHIRSFALRPNE